jgi:hypothetical protein
MLRRALVTGAACLALSATASAATPHHPLLTAKGRHTLTVSGRHFEAREKVRVVLNVARRQVRHAHASRRGTFKVTFRNVPAGPCDGFSIVAVGDGGSRAMVARMHPDCLVR